MDKERWQTILSDHYWKGGKEHNRRVDLNPLLVHVLEQLARSSS